MIMRRVPARKEKFHIQTNHNKAEVSRPQTHSASFQRVTYGWIDGAYYCATTSRRFGSDGGHSVTRKLESDGKVDTVQTLHNLDEGELASFEQAWGANTDRHFQPFDFPANFGTSDGLLRQLAGGALVAQK
ncbi:hypothetical protein ACS0TY_022561 [Phlomoides rotata]